MITNDVQCNDSSICLMKAEKNMRKNTKVENIFALNELFHYNFGYLHFMITQTFWTAFDVLQILKRMMILV